MSKSTVLSAALVLMLAVAVRAETAAEELDQLVENWYDEFLQLNPIMATMNGVHDYDDQFPNFLSPQYIAKVRESEERYLEAVERIDPDLLDVQGRLNWEIFRRDRLEGLAQLDLPDRYLPVDQMSSVPVMFVQLGMPGVMTPFETAKDYENFLSRIDGFAVFMDQAIANLREGVELKIVLPKIIVEKTLPVLASQVVEDPTESAFYAAVAEFPEGIDSADQQRLRAAYVAAIEDKIVPAYAKMHDYMRDEYMAHARESIGLAGIPGGEEWYRFAIKQHTGTDMTAQEIHELGLREVARIEAEMDRLASEVGFEGDWQALRAWVAEQPELRYSSEEEVLERYRAYRDVVAPHIDELFSRVPSADFEIRAVEPFRQATTPGAHYMPASPDGSRPGIFYVNTGGWEGRNHSMAEALFLHEAVPGHHFQVALARELDELPRFRRFNIYTAYVEGWGLYAESLGAELGMYRDPYQRLGQLSSELFRARRLVVDTGIHALGWTRDEALAVLPNEVEVDRYMIMPGQALAYKVGELKIKELRERAKQRLGERFDIREFHAQILQDGALPLDVLESKVDRWIDQQLAG